VSDSHLPGYTAGGDLFDDVTFNWRMLIFANLLALIPLGLAVVVLWLPYQFYVALGAPLALAQGVDWPAWAFWLFGIGVIVGSMMLHEALHGLALWLQGHRPRFGWAFGYLYATIYPGDTLAKPVYLRMVLAPVIVISFGGALLLPLLPPSLGQIVLIALLLNAAASIGDLAVARRVLRWSPDARFADHNGGIKVFLPRSGNPAPPTC
jgi:hypothetical protein